MKKMRKKTTPFCLTSCSYKTELVLVPVSSHEVQLLGPTRPAVRRTDRLTDRPARPRAQPRAVQSQTIGSRLPRAAKNQRIGNSQKSHDYIWSFAMQDLVVLAIRTDHLFSSCSALEAVILRLLKL
jgi:hypothetical protein